MMAIIFQMSDILSVNCSVIMALQRVAKPSLSPTLRPSQLTVFPEPKQPCYSDTHTEKERDRENERAIYLCEVAVLV